VDDLAAMPHLLIAGTTGSGKSVSLNCIISSMLTVCPPEELEFYMIDPKGVELVHYDGIPHMKEKMVTSPHYAKDMLERLVIEMRRRLTLLKSKLVRDIKEYNAIMVKNGTPRMPRIVAVIDEFGDLMMHDRKAFTHLVAEISQIARATGIHMIVATQRPSVDVISGRIKVNFPGRMAFKVTSQTDSKVILQRKGAESLLWMGDMLYLSPTRSTLTRIHAPWVPLTDVKAVADKLREIESKRLEEERKKRMAEEEQRRRELAARHTPTQSPSFVPPKTLNRGEEETMEIDFNWATPKKA
jgi:S-DNA-T family DNA segregation ATPase FtsK/SpoIIIE